VDSILLLFFPHEYFKTTPNLYHKHPWEFPIGQGRLGRLIPESENTVRNLTKAIDFYPVINRQKRDRVMKAKCRDFL
jgi:hypothetical protein